VHFAAKAHWTPWWCKEIPHAEGIAAAATGDLNQYKWSRD